MYLDGVVIYGIIVVIATAAVVVYATKYMVKHIRDDLHKHPGSDDMTAGHKS